MKTPKSTEGCRASAPVNSSADWDDVCYLYGGIWSVSLPDGSQVELNCNGQRGVGFRAMSCFGYDVARKAKFTLKNQ